MNLEGNPDGKFVSIGPHGYILIDASNDNLDSITAYNAYLCLSETTNPKECVNPITGK